MNHSEMNVILESARAAIVRHRLPLMKYCLAVACLCSLISLAAQQFNNNLIPLAATLAINLIFLFGLDLLMLKALHDEPYSLHDFSQFTGYLKSLLPLFGIYGLILAGGVFALQAMIHLGAVLLVLPALLGVGVIFLNCINHLTLFSMIETHQSAWRALKGGTKLFFQSGKLIMHIVLKTIVLILLGSLAVYVLNVFVYAPQIDAVLKSTPEITEALIDPYFSTNLSYLIQSVGMQLVVSYIAIVSGMTCGVYYLKQRKAITR